MTVWAICMVRDEADVIEAVLRHVAAQGVAGIIVADNMSADGTGRIVQRLHLDLDCDLVYQPDDEPGYWQSRKMTRLANQASEYGAEWVWPFDADELWYFGTAHKPLATVLDEADGDYLEARLWHHFETAVDPPRKRGVSPFQTMQYRGPDEAPIGKVIVRWRPGCVIEAGNHAVHFAGYGNKSTTRDVQVRHFPYRSEEQFVTKAINGSRAYAATDLPRDVGQHWREYGIHYQRGGEDALREIYRRHFFYDLPSAAGLVYDPARLDS